MANCELSIANGQRKEVSHKREQVCHGSLIIDHLPLTISKGDLEMEKESKVLRPTDTRPTYEPPQAMRLNQVHAGEGACEPGSGDSEYCYFSGNAANAECLSAGNSATGSCNGGSGVV